MLQIANIAELDVDIAAMLRDGGVLGFYGKWIEPLGDDETRTQYVRYVSERIHSMLMDLKGAPDVRS